MGIYKIYNSPKLTKQHTFWGFTETIIPQNYIKILVLGNYRHTANTTITYKSTT